MTTETTMRSDVRRAQMAASLGNFIQREADRLERLRPRVAGDDCYWDLSTGLDSLQALTRVYQYRSDGNATEQRYAGTSAPRLSAVTERAGSASDGVYRLTGRVHSYNEEKEIAEGFHEVILPGAFRTVVNDRYDTRVLFNHDANWPLARIAAGTLELEETAEGLNMRATVPRNAQTRFIMDAIRSKTVTGMSFAFRVGKDRWVPLSGTAALREIIEVSHLFDVAPVSFPAYDRTWVSATDEGRSAASPASRRPSHTPLPADWDQVLRPSRQTFGGDAESQRLAKWAEGLSPSRLRGSDDPATNYWKSWVESLV